MVNVRKIARHLDPECVVRARLASAQPGFREKLDPAFARSEAGRRLRDSLRKSGHGELVNPATDAADAAAAAAEGASCA